MTKRIIALMLSLCCAFVLAGCGAAAPQNDGPKDYIAAITAARPAEDNEANVIFSYANNSWTASSAYAADLTSEDIESQASMCLTMLGLTTEDVEEAHMSVSLMMVQSYGIAVVKPAEGKADTVKAGLQSFIDGQKAAQENYLADQFEIASNAKLETLKSGEIVLVMCENQDQVFDSIKKAL